MLVERRLLPEEEARAHYERAVAEDSTLEEVLIREGVFTRERLLRALENHFFCPAADLEKVAYNPEVLGQIPSKLAHYHLALPLGIEDGTLRVAMAQPDNARALDSLAQMARRQIIPSVALRNELKALIDAHYGRLDEVSPEPAPGFEVSSARRRSFALSPELREQRRSSLQLKLEGLLPHEALDKILKVAILRDVTDVHLQPAEHDMMVRYRLDGMLYTVARFSHEMAKPLVSRAKVLAGMDIAEHRLPQDGRHTAREGELLVDLRISCLPSQFGEKMVLRLLRKNANLLNLDNLRMPPAVREAFNECLDLPQGMFLVTGPTGSGKTTTLYAALNSLDRDTLNILTLEDPIEYSLPGITQTQMNEEIGLTFASGLRTFLRQDPNVILLGEIRDMETVEIACRAALTGHKVFSTLHTNDSCQAVTRLIDMGTAPYLIAATLRGVLAQRLVRQICPECKEGYLPSPAELQYLGYPKIKELKRGRGCPACAGTGYKGRHAIYEYFQLNERFHRMILDRASPFELREVARRNGMLMLSDFARREVIEGNTTVAEIQRAVMSDEARERTCPGCGRTVGADFTVCPFCKRPLKEVCAGCGAPVDPDWEACPKCGRSIERAWQRLFCRNCLAPVEPEWTTCLYCGAGLK